MNRPTIHMPHWPKPITSHVPGSPRERCQKICDRLGSPEKKLPPVIHVAGTNGKGSTVAALRSILVAAGYRVHAYTSPHIARFNERIVLAGEMMSDEYLYDVLERTRIATSDLPHHFFDATTAAALLAFSEIEADVLLLETGMGGEHDPTNVVGEKVMTILTSISYDHMDFLGDNLIDIAAQKVGIWREGIPCVVAQQTAEVNALLRAAAKEKNVPLISHGLQWHVNQKNDHFMLQESAQKNVYDMPLLHGVYQMMNAGCAIVALQQLSSHFDIKNEHINDGLKTAIWPARLEKTAQHNTHEIWCDGAHNEGGFLALAEHIKMQWKDLPIYVIFGTTKGKEVAKMLGHVKDVAEAIYAVPVAAEPHAYAPHEIAAQAKHVGIDMIEMESVEAAKQAIIARVEPCRILICGSLYLRLEC